MQSKNIEKVGEGKNGIINEKKANQNKENGERHISFYEAEVNGVVVEPDGNTTTNHDITSPPSSPVKSTHYVEDLRKKTTSWGDVWKDLYYTDTEIAEMKYEAHIEETNMPQVIKIQAFIRGYQTRKRLKRRQQSNGNNNSKHQSINTNIAKKEERIVGKAEIVEEATGSFAARLAMFSKQADNNSSGGQEKDDRFSFKVKGNNKKQQQQDKQEDESNQAKVNSSTNHDSESRNNGEAKQIKNVAENNKQDSTEQGVSNTSTAESDAAAPVAQEATKKGNQTASMTREQENNDNGNNNKTEKESDDDNVVHEEEPRVVGACIKLQSFGRSVLSKNLVMKIIDVKIAEHDACIKLQSLFRASLAKNRVMKILDKLIYEMEQKLLRLQETKKQKQQQRQ